MITLELDDDVATTREGGATETKAAAGLAAHSTARAAGATLAYFMGCLSLSVLCSAPPVHTSACLRGRERGDGLGTSSAEPLRTGGNPTACGNRFFVSSF